MGFRIKFKIPLEEKYKLDRNDANAAGRMAVKHIRKEVAQGRTGKGKSMGNYTKKYAASRARNGLQVFNVDMNWTGKMMKDLHYKKFPNNQGFTVMFRTRKSSSKYAYQKENRKFLGLSKKAEQDILKMLIKRLGKK